MKHFAPLLFFLAMLSPAISNSQNQSPDSCLVPIGMNLAGPSDYGGEWPFNDIMKYCRTWISQNTVWYGGGQNMWDTGLQEYFDYDENGYPLKVPIEVDHPNADTSQMLTTVWANTFSLPEGTYVILYDGEGVLDFRFDAQIISQTPGRIEVEVTHNDQIMALQIKQSTEGNHIRNIRFLLPGTEDTYEENPWCEQWLEKLEPFRQLRFMDWGYTNNSELRHWSNRAKVDDYTYTRVGIPYEWMIEICNYKQADAWVCVPHLANDAYITNLATLFRDNLNPNLTVYVEYSNELWNWMFAQAHYGLDSLDQNLDWPERLGPKIESVFDIWDSVFSGQQDRLFKVVGAQLSYPDIVDRILGHITPGKADAITSTAYIGLNSDTLSHYGANLTVNKVFEMANWELENDFDYYLKTNKQIADDEGIGLVYYEGGQHFTPHPFGSIQPYNDTLVAAQTDSRMYDLYCRIIDSLRAVATEPSVFMNFSFISPFSGQYGSWGVLQNQFTQSPPYEEAPKYQALLHNIYSCNTPQTQLITLKQGWSGISAYLLPTETNMETLFAPVADNLVILNNYEGFYFPDAQTNTLEHWNPHSGYRIKMDTQQQLEIHGEALANKTIMLQAGWNLLPVLSAEIVAIETIASQLGDNLVVMSEIAGTNVYWPQMGVFSLQTLEPGKAYFIKVLETTPVNFQD